MQEALLNLFFYFLNKSLCQLNKKGETADFLLSISIKSNLTLLHKFYVFSAVLLKIQ